MTIEHWETPVPSSSLRALILDELSYSNGNLSMLVQDEADKAWRIVFDSVLLFQVFTEQIASAHYDLPRGGGFFEVKNSSIHQRVNDSGLPYLGDSREYVVSLYDQVVSVLTNSEVITFIKL